MKGGRIYLSLKSGLIFRSFSLPCFLYEAFFVWLVFIIVKLEPPHRLFPDDAGIKLISFFLLFCNKKLVGMILKSLSFLMTDIFFLFSLLNLEATAFP